MGTYTTNKELFMPTVGEQGWGELVNNNFSTIDTFLKPIAISGNTYTFTGNLVGNQSGGSISATSINNSGTLTQTGASTFMGKITANGGIETKALTATSISNSGTLTQTGTSTFDGKITANGGVNDYEERITALEAGEFEMVNAETIKVDSILVPPITTETPFCIYSNICTPFSASGTYMSASSDYYSTGVTHTLIDNVPFTRNIVKSELFTADVGIPDVRKVTITTGGGSGYNGRLDVYHNGVLLVSTVGPTSNVFDLDITLPFKAVIVKTASNTNMQFTVSLYISTPDIKYYI